MPRAFTAESIDSVKTLAYTETVIASNDSGYAEAKASMVSENLPDALRHGSQVSSITPESSSASMTPVSYATAMIHGRNHGRLPSCSRFGDSR